MPRREMLEANGVATALPAPGGYIVDLDHPQSQAHVVIYWVAAAGNALALMFVAQHLYTKVVLLKNFRLEDISLFLAWIISVGIQTILVYMFTVGILGVHMWEMPVNHYSFYKVMELVVAVTYAPCVGLAKLSLLLYYRRLSPQTWLGWVVVATMVIVVGCSLGTSFSLVFGCNPIARSWDMTVKGGTCIDRDALHLATVVLNMATSLVILGLPIPVVASWKMTNLQRAGLLVIFAIGSLTVATSVLRLVVLLPALPDKDQTWSMAYSYMVSRTRKPLAREPRPDKPCSEILTDRNCDPKWICVEANLLIICAALPTLGRFFQQVAPSLLGHGGNDLNHDDDGAGDGDGPRPSRPRDAGTAKSGGKRQHRHYNQFSEFPEHPMRSLHGVDLRPDEIQMVETRAGANSRCSRMWEARPNKSDGDSEKAIFQTWTMTVTYQTRDGGGIE
ncbi:hypothetical protein PG987_013705 [Apiospora arundinis]